ncbi:MAG: hypothetical protein UU08_C0010G0009 [Candidatus Uhrbacteria bacterium GW2011_GWE2_40_58]|nr:MAG: hypothetical protein UT94_C0012G0008 [Candidatus Uhrbacteria bacterium GW2011_GWF2_40_263]KKR67714.1 MAG: hypothetical protein UU08_C0010G0009 [Candidatus Uhrbacteria bacterium GW2011_GWE2_40_58]OGL96636.1 MAG: hypothetical protein A2332_02700 [Candidatus Uhrbacteria bacterium RIFOXYB2_FULL_41_18]HBK35264.1 hypothetical protein [Candidatus Uhrbacteria bacterium]HCB56216.1 hypothetical protein [Candidatus Uhrbacteria bacterium]
MSTSAEQVVKIVLPDAIKTEAEAFQKAMVDESDFQRMSKLLKTIKEQDRGVLKVLAVICSSGILFILASLLFFHSELVIYFGIIIFFVGFLILFMQYSSAIRELCREEVARLGTEEAKEKRQHVLSGEGYYLAWILEKRVAYLNDAIRVVGSNESESWKTWVMERLAPWHQEVSDEIRARMFVGMSPEKTSFPDAVDRLNHFLSIPPKEFEKLLNVERRRF